MIGYFYRNRSLRTVRVSDDPSQHMKHCAYEGCDRVIPDFRTEGAKYCSAMCRSKAQWLRAKAKRESAVTVLPFAIVLNPMFPLQIEALLRIFQ
jgi:hypothetical protein